MEGDMKAMVGGRRWEATGGARSTARPTLMWSGYTPLAMRTIHRNLFMSSPLRARHGREGGSSARGAGCHAHRQAAVAASEGGGAALKQTDPPIWQLPAHGIVTPYERSSHGGQGRGDGDSGRRAGASSPPHLYPALPPKMTKT